MPYRHAHRWVAALAPLIVLSFWSGYFSPAAQRTPALHAHAAAASLWLLLLFVQAWSARAHRLALHRVAGRAVFVAAPVFAAAGMIVLVDGARRFAAGATPFHIANVPPLTLCDFVALATFLALVTSAVAERRRVRRHAGAMLATAVLVLPPILARLAQHMPGFPSGGAAGLSGFALSFLVTEVGVAILAAELWRRDRQSGGAFALVAISGTAQIALFFTLGQTGWWRGVVRAFADAPFAAAGLPAAILTALLLAAAWSRSAQRTPVLVRT